MSSRVKIVLGDDSLFGTGAVSIESVWVLMSVSMDMTNLVGALGVGAGVGTGARLLISDKPLTLTGTGIPCPTHRYATASFLASWMCRLWLAL